MKYNSHPFANFPHPLKTSIKRSGSNNTVAAALHPAIDEDKSRSMSFGQNLKSPLLNRL